MRPSRAESFVGYLMICYSGPSDSPMMDLGNVAFFAITKQVAGAASAQSWMFSIVPNIISVMPAATTFLMA
jgi:hypothetical protein